MKITDIQIEQFGAWQHLSLPLSHSGLNVFYGPNEAGKTTLMRFIRSVLYGFEPFGLEMPDGHSARPVWEGGLRIEHHGQTCEVRRQTSDHKSGHEDEWHRGLVTVTGMDREAPVDELLAELLAGTEENVFQRVFAIGLQELQELATLHHDDVAHHIYGLTLGPDGQRLLDVTTHVENERRRLLDPERNSGKLAELLERDARLSAEIQSLEHLRDRYAHLCRDRDGLEADIAGLKTRQNDLQGQLRGHLLLERVWGPWEQIHESRAELDKLPVVAGFPEHGLGRLDELDAELDSAHRCREALLSEAGQLRKEAEALEGNREVRVHAATMQSFIDQREWIREAGEKTAAAEVRAHELHEQLDAKIVELGPDWSLARLEQTDTSPAAHYRMVGMARKYQAALSRRGKARRRLKGMSNVCRRAAANIDDQLQELGGRTLDEALQTARQRLTDLEDLGRLKLCEAELEQRRAGLREQLEHLESRPPLPKWVYGVLGFFAVAGLVSAGLGFATGMTGNMIAGLMWAFLGATCGGLTWALKTHFGNSDRENIERLRDEADENEVRLRETREAIARLVEGDEQLMQGRGRSLDGTPLAPPEGTPRKENAPGRLPGVEALENEQDPPNGSFVLAAQKLALPSSTGGNARASEAELIANTTRRLAELEQLAAAHKRVQSRRRRLSELRARFQGVQREVSTARQNWCELLKQLGLTETVRIDEAFETWQRVVEADEQRRAWQTAAKELATHQQTLQSFQRRIQELGHRMQCWDLDYKAPLDVLATWEEQLKELARHTAEQRRLRRDEKGRRREAAEYQTRIDELKVQRSALLVQGGAADREEFEQRAEWAGRRRELDEFLEMARAELDDAAESEPDLAIVEEDLLAYEPAENGERIKVLNQELEELDRGLQQAFETLGSIKQEIKTLSGDHRPSELRFERAQVEDQIKQLAERWFAVQLAGRAVEQLRSAFERRCQPETLAAASRFLEQLTRGKYHNIWTPLGQRRLSIDDDCGRTFTVEQLSNGTREQLFLAIRLAMVREFSRRGIELPLVLDDVLVNFDHLRTEAVIDTLMQFTEKGQQVLLFTCHLHLAHLFESRGLEPTWLPARHAPLEERRAG